MILSDLLSEQSEVIVNDIDLFSRGFRFEAITGYHPEHDSPEYEVFDHCWKRLDHMRVRIRKTERPIQQVAEPDVVWHDNSI
jgi:hypothetical protein